MAAKVCVVVSFYDRRPVKPLWDLFSALERVRAGCDFHTVIVVNRTGDHELSLPQSPRLVDMLERSNTGMNIGAWDAGWRHFTGFDAYVFLQDECFPVKADWLKALVGVALDDDVGLVGESMNLAWDKPWDVLRAKQAAIQMPEHFVDGKPANRVDAYLDFLQRYGIPPGATGRHLRSLVWAVRRSVLERIDGFPIGANYGECIAAEIGTTKRVEAARLRAVQVAEQPFAYVRHKEWNQDRPGGPFVHSPPPIEYSRAPLAAPDLLSWRATMQLLYRRFRHPLRRGLP